MRVTHQNRLRSLNHLMALATGADRDSIREINRAIEFTESQHLSSEAFADLGVAAKSLLCIQSGSMERFSFEHMDVLPWEYSLLWLQATVKAIALRHDPSAEVLLLVTGLRQAICPKGKRFTPRLQLEYLAAREVIDSAISSRPAPCAAFHIIIL